MDEADAGMASRRPSRTLGGAHRDAPRVRGARRDPGIRGARGRPRHHAPRRAAGHRAPARRPRDRAPGWCPGSTGSRTCCGCWPAPPSRPRSTPPHQPVSVSSTTRRRDVPDGTAPQQPATGGACHRDGDARGRHGRGPQRRQAGRASAARPASASLGLLAELAVSARASGSSVHIGGCPPQVDGPPIPFAAVTQALRSILRSVDARSLDGLLGPARTELARLLPEIGEAAPDSSASAHDGAARLYEAILLLVERAAPPQRDAVGARGHALVRRAHQDDSCPTSAETSVTAPVLIAVSYRTEALPAGDQLPDLLHELARVSGGELLHLAPLVPADARMLLELIDTGQHTDDELATIVRRSAGVPLYLEELSLPTGRSGEAGPPPSMRTSVDGRLVRLPPDARLMVELLAVCSGPTDARLLDRAPGSRIPRQTRRFARGSIAISWWSPARLGSRWICGTTLSGRQSWPAWCRVDRHPSTSDSLELSWNDRASAQGQRRSRRRLSPNTCLRPVRNGEPCPSCCVRQTRPAWRLTSRKRTAHTGARSTSSGTPHRRSQAHDGWSAWCRAPWPHGWQAIPPALQSSRPAPSQGWTTRPTRALSMARVHLGRYLADDGRHLEALDVLAASARLPTTPLVRLRAHMEQVRIHLALRDHDAAVELAGGAVVLAEASGAKREAARAYASLGVALSMNGLHPEALLALTEARSIPRASDTQVRARASRFPDSLLGYVDASTVLARAGEPEAAGKPRWMGWRPLVGCACAAPGSQAITATAALTLLRDGRWEEAAEDLPEASLVVTAGPTARSCSPSWMYGRANWLAHNGCSTSLSTTMSLPDPDMDGWDFAPQPSQNSTGPAGRMSPRSGDRRQLAGRRHGQRPVAACRGCRTRLAHRSRGRAGGTRSQGPLVARWVRADGPCPVRTGKL